jgi:hypothetical protein
MNTFIHILQKVTGTKNVIYPICELREEGIVPNIWKDYYKHESNNDKDNAVYCVYNYINSVLYNMYDEEMCECVWCSCVYSVKNKYGKIKYIMDDLFIDNKTKTQFMNNISKTQRVYRGFSKLAYLYKYKRAETQITKNMMYDEIDPEHRNTIELYDGGSRYLFTKYDLTRIINVALSNSPYIFPEPLIIRNPYNNVPFSKSILYTIYFRLIDNSLKFPVLFHNFVWLNFDIDIFRVENECLIREHYFREYIYNSTNKMMKSKIRTMLSVHGYTVKKDFPVKDLIRIFRPYLYLFMVACYHISGLEKRKMSLNYLNAKINELYEDNPKFGRRTYIRVPTTYIKNKPVFVYEKTFNMDAPKFTMNQARMYHIDMQNQNFSDDETDDETDDNSVS